MQDASTLLRPVQTYQRLTGRYPFKASMTSGIYWIYQTSRDRAVYVGSTNSIETRLQAHKGALNSGKHHNVRLVRTWNKYGAGDFQFLSLEECPVGLLIEREQFWIDAIAPTCNMAATADNPNRGRPLSKEHRARISASNKGMASWAKGTKLSEEHKRKVSEANTGKKRSAESRRRISLGLVGKTPWSKGQTFSAEYRKKLSDAKKGKPAHNKGVKYGPEFSKKVSDAHKGRPLGKEHRQHISEANSGRVVSDETKAKISAAHKKKWQDAAYREMMRDRLRQATRPAMPDKEVICSDCGATFAGKCQGKRVLCPVCRKAAWKIANKKSLMKRRGKL